jgi:hypothetical protein
MKKHTIIIFLIFGILCFLGGIMLSRFLNTKSITPDSAKAVADKKHFSFVDSLRMNRINKQKFEKLYQAGKSVESAIKVGVNFRKFQEYLQDFSTELSIAKNNIRAEKEKELLKIYSEAANILEDSLKFWNYSIFASSGDISLERVKAEEEIKPVLEKLKLPSVDSMYEKEGDMIPKKEFKKIWAEGILQGLWGDATKKLGEADKIFTGK